eukprot:CAMPEP_0198726112 /NCGR_PEP_ID=MMETSP1475-20131203/3277_1 /TAXON_ID= ORGANISM="Unidentified sp., Strain CCMP1999" /NCGR_SAMPLE_ID=MMETSP1475 /ASSEMBLY_ACC=CAM_ASM_001111 /LENGTH=151 /DNA_ID=CAMNT_0044488005 /DNA_START=577 /DNA_END=1032 /DNA_ORIENTATION=+
MTGNLLPPDVYCILLQIVPTTPPSSLASLAAVSSSVSPSSSLPFGKIHLEDFFLEVIIKTWVVLFSTSCLTGTQPATVPFIVHVGVMQVRLGFIDVRPFQIFANSDAASAILTAVVTTPMLLPKFRVYPCISSMFLEDSPSHTDVPSALTL